MSRHRVAIIVERENGDGWDEVCDYSLHVGTFGNVNDALECVSTLQNEIENNNWEWTGIVEEPEKVSGD